MKKTALLSLILSPLFFLLAASAAFAQLSTPLTVAPARQEVDLKAGENSTIIYKLINTGDSPIIGSLSVVDFIVTGNDGKPQFLDNYTGLPVKYAASSWFALPYNRLAIPAHNKVEMQIKITAPKNALPGGHYAAIIFEPGADVTRPNIVSKAGQVSIAPRLAALVSITIPGSYVETANLIQFFAPNFSQNGPIDITTNIKNTSPVHIRPVGTITVTNMLGDVTTVLPLEETNIFPDAQRLYKNTISTKWLVGRYRADLSAAYGSSGKVLTGTIFFTVFPIMLSIYLLILILAIVFVIKYAIKRNRKHQQELEAEVAELKKEVSDLEHKP